MFTSWVHVDTRLILSTCSLNWFDLNPFVNGSTIINEVMMCSMGTVCLCAYVFEFSVLGTIRIPVILEEKDCRARNYHNKFSVASRKLQS
jgi:hypothetical protein